MVFHNFYRTFLCDSNTILLKVITLGLYRIQGQRTITYVFLSSYTRGVESKDCSRMMIEDRSNLLVIYLGYEKRGIETKDWSRG